MNNWKKVVVLSGLCSCTLSMNAMVSTNLETGSSLADTSVVLNNYYARNIELEKQLTLSYSSVQSKSAQSNAAAGSANDQDSGNKASSQPGNVSGGAGKAKTVQETVSKPKSSAYDDIAVSRISGMVNIRTEVDTNSGVTGEINNDCAATILGTVDGEGGKWHKIQSGSVTGYIKASYFVAGQQVESRTKQVGTTYGAIVGTPSLRLRQSLDMEGKTLTLLSEGVYCVVMGEEGDSLKAQVDSGLGGYVFKEYMKTSVESSKATSVEEEKVKATEEVKHEKGAEKTLQALGGVKKAGAARETTAATIKAEKTTEVPATAAPKKEETKGTGAATTIAADPENGKDGTAATPTTAKAPETVDSKEPGSPGGTSTEVAFATYDAVVAYTKQFLGNPYVYGGTSLTSGADCPGSTQSVFAHFDISIGRSSRDQAARGKSIPISDAKSRGLLFYVSGDYINHVATYIDGDQAIHANNPTTGICIMPADHRTPYKAVMFLD